MAFTYLSSTSPHPPQRPCSHSITTPWMDSHGIIVTVRAEARGCLCCRARRDQTTG